MDLVSFGNKYWTISVPASSVNHLFKPRTFLLISWGFGIVFIPACMDLLQILWFSSLVMGIDDSELPIGVWAECTV